MRHHPSPDSSCRPPRKPLGPCAKPTGRTINLTGLIQEYKWECGDNQQASRELYRDFTTLTEAIKYATGSVGKVPNHQRRVGRETLKKACKRLLRHKDELKACQSFSDLLNLIKQHTADIPRFGKLAVYDTACRLGIYLGLCPEVVYLHAGTQKGAKAMGLDTRRGYVEMDELPGPFRLLEPWECEDFLCIYKNRFAGMDGTAKGCRPKRR